VRCVGRNPRSTRLHVSAAEPDAVPGSLHEQQTRQNLEEQSLDERRHDVSVGRAQVDVQHEDRHDDRARDEEHREQQISADQRRRQRRRGVDIGDQQQEYDERREDCHRHRDLLARVGRHVEQQYGQRTDDEARQDQIHL